MKRAVLGLALAAFSQVAVAATTADNDWHPAPDTAKQLDRTKLDAMEQALAANAYPNTTSVLIVLNGELGYEHYFGDGSITKPNDTRSATKSLTSLAMGLAVAEGKVKSVEAPAFAFLKDMAPFANDTALKRQITIADLLTMSSALDCDDNTEASPGNEENMYPKNVWTRFVVDLPTKADWKRDATGRGPWFYCTAGTFLLGQILQRATAQPVDKFIDSSLLDPLGAGVRNWDRSPTGEVMTGGGLELTSRDLAKLAWMAADGGRWRGKQIVPAAWLSQVQTVRRPSIADMHYGYQYWQRLYQTSCGPVEVWFMAGNGGNHIMSIPSLHAAIVVTRTAYNTRGMHQQTMELTEKFALAAIPCAAAR